MNIEIFEIRLKKLQEGLIERGLDAVLITNDINRAYISGFVGTAGYGVVTRDNASLVTDSRYTQQAKEQAFLFKVSQFEGKPYKELNNILKEQGIVKLGFEDDTVTYDQYTQFQKELEVKELFPVQDLLTGIRKIKDETEIAKMKKAASIADKAFSHILSFIKPGMTEQEVALELEFFMKRQGASALSFDTIIVSGTRSSLPHGKPTDKIINAGELVTMDFGCIYEGYCSDMTRTIGIGFLNKEQEKIYRIVLESQMAALDTLKAGIIGKDVDSVARKIIDKYGYGKYFGHGLGHGVGCEIHEDPRLSPLGEEVLKPGMVVTVEPGIYIEDLGGVRIEDMIVVRENGIENLTSSPKDLIII